MTRHPRLRTVAEWAVWPFVVGSGLVAYALLTDRLGLRPEFAILLQFGYVITLIPGLEYVLPCHASWSRYDGQLRNDIVYNVIFPVAQILGAAVCLALAAALKGHVEPLRVWPTEAPFLAQAALAALVLDLVYYGYHRAFHEVPQLWPFHAVHHSSLQLHIVNNARVHPLEVAFIQFLLLATMMVLGIPLEVFGWFLALQQGVGLMTHGNLATRTGWLSRIFNTPEQHQWHHSPDPRIGNTNYGSTILVWDHVFGTFHGPRDRRPPEAIGVTAPVPETLLGQLALPFRGKGVPSPEPLHTADAPGPST